MWNTGSKSKVKELLNSMWIRNKNKPPGYSPPCTDTSCARYWVRLPRKGASQRPQALVRVTTDWSSLHRHKCRAAPQRWLGRPAALWQRHHHSHFSEEEVEAQKAQCLGLGCEPGGLTPDPVLTTQYRAEAKDRPLSEQEPAPKCLWMESRPGIVDYVHSFFQVGESHNC